MIHKANKSKNKIIKPQVKKQIMKEPIMKQQIIKKQRIKEQESEKQRITDQKVKQQDGISQVFMLGKWQKLPVVSLTATGAYLGSEEQKVLLPGKQVPEGTRPGNTLEVFLYKDSSDRFIATTHTPRITVGEIAPLQVRQITGIGAFLDWGLEKDLLLPFREQTGKLEEGLYYPVALYVDKSDRLAATMWIDKYMKGADPDEKRRQKSLIILQADAENVYIRIRMMGGSLPYSDKADPEVIRRDFGLSKNAFKRAVGVLYKARRLMIQDDGTIELL